jgi:hypothetical protein
MDRGKNYILGVFEDEDVLKKAVTNVRDNKVNIFEVFTPYPVHGLEDVLGYKRSKLPVVAFLFGITGTCLALFMQIYMLVIDWPQIIGGKPYFAYMDFIPVAFELTVLLSAFGMVGTFMVTNDLKPHKVPRIFDLRSTDDKHIMAIDLADNSLDADGLSEVLKAAGASEVNKKDFED